MAFGRKRERLSILLDWATVRYRTVWLALAGLVAVCLLAVVTVWHVRGRDQREARVEIEQAERIGEEATFYARSPRGQEIQQAGDLKLEEAREHFTRRDFSDARTSAIVAQNTYQKLIDIGRGEGTTRGEVRFYRIEGEVRVKRAGQFHWEAASSRMLLRIGDQVKTSEGSGAQIIYFDGSITTIKPGSLLEIKDLYEEPLTRRKRVAEKLTWGEIEATTRKPEVEGSFHEVVTDTAVTRSRNDARFQIRSDQGSGTSEVTLFEGKLDVSAGENRVELSDRERVRVRGGNLGRVEQVPMVPRLLQPADQRVFTHPDPVTARTTLVWDRVPEAARYRLQLSDRSLFTEVLVDNDGIRAASVELSGLLPGGYHWRVAAIDEQGRTGPFSPARKFRITRTQVHERGDSHPPPLVVRDFVQNGPIVIISGSTEPGATLWVDNERVDVDDRGEFSTVVRLRREGVNRVRLSAQDPAGNETSRTLEAVVESY